MVQQNPFVQTIANVSDGYCAPSKQVKESQWSTSCIHRTGCPFKLDMMLGDPWKITFYCDLDLLSKSAKKSDTWNFGAMTSVHQQGRGSISVSMRFDPFSRDDVHSKIFTYCVEVCWIMEEERKLSCKSIWISYRYYRPGKCHLSEEC